MTMDDNDLTTEEAMLVEKPAPPDRKQSTSAAKPKATGKAWRNLVETLHPDKRKKRRVREFDSIMRREIENPITEEQDEEWRTILSDEDEGAYLGILPRFIRGRAADDGNWSAALNWIVPEESSVYSPTSAAKKAGKEDIGGAQDNLSLGSALACIEPEEAEEEITALPVYVVPQQQLPEKTQPKKLRKAKSMLL